MKNKLKQDFEMQKRNAAKEELAECAKRYHQCLNRLLKETNDRGDERNPMSTRNTFNHNFWKFRKNLLNDVNVETTQPTFSKVEVHSYFSCLYSSSPHVFVDPPWLPRAPALCEHTLDRLAGHCTIALRNISGLSGMRMWRLRHWQST